MQEIENIKFRIEPLRNALINHKMYKDVKTIKDVRIFMNGIERNFLTIKPQLSTIN